MRLADKLAREHVLARDRNRCVRCGSEDELEWAHIITRGMGGGNRYIRWEPDNAVTLCHRCHHWLTHDPLKFRKFIAATYGPDRWDELKLMQAVRERQGHSVDVEAVIRGFREMTLTPAEMEEWASGAWLG